MSNPKKNFIYNLIYQLLILIIPLITAPYLSRVVGADGVGIYSYTYSIIYYFMIVTLLGVNNYGNRSIAKVRDDKMRLSKTFFGIYFMQLMMGILMLCCYFGSVLLFNYEYKNILLIQGIYILSAILDINWFYFGIEEFKMTITRNAILKLGSIILIFLLVKSKYDLWIYTLIMSGMTCLSQIVLWGFIFKRINRVKVEFSDVLKHIKPNLVLFIPVLAVSLYKMMDKVMLGWLCNVSEVGFYENAEKIINVPMTLITALGTVMLPRISNIIAKGDQKKANEYMSKSINFVMFMSFAMCFGLMGVGYNFSTFYFGSQFQKTGVLIILLSITMPFLAFANVVRTQYLIPYEKDKIYIISVLIGAVINLIMNIVFIPKFSGIGACFGTIAAEFAVMFYQSFSIRKEVKIKTYIKESIPYFLKSLVMFFVIFTLNFINISEILRLLLQLILGFFVYIILNIRYILIELNLIKMLQIKLFNNRRDKVKEYI